MPDEESGEATPLRYARRRHKRRRDAVQVVFVFVVAVNTLFFTIGAALQTLTRRVPSSPPPIASPAKWLVEYSFFAYLFLFLTGLFVRIARRREDRYWLFVLSVVFCALMAFAGLCADVMSH